MQLWDPDDQHLSAPRVAVTEKPNNDFSVLSVASGHCMANDSCINRAQLHHSQNTYPAVHTNWDASHAEASRNGFQLRIITIVVFTKFTDILSYLVTPLICQGHHSSPARLTTGIRGSFLRIAYIVIINQSCGAREIPNNPARTADAPEMSIIECETLPVCRGGRTRR